MWFRTNRRLVLSPSSEIFSATQLSHTRITLMVRPVQLETLLRPFTSLGTITKEWKWSTWSQLAVLNSLSDNFGEYKQCYIGEA